MGGGVCAKDVWHIDGKGAEIETASEEASDRHDDVIDERIDDGGEGTTDGDTDGEINNAAAVDKLFELANERTVGKLFVGFV